MDIKKQTARAERIARRTNELGFTKDGRPMVVDQALEVLASLEGFRNWHTFRSADSTRSNLTKENQAPEVSDFDRFCEEVRKAAVKSGILSDSAPVTVSHLLVVLDDMAEFIKKTCDKESAKGQREVDLVVDGTDEAGNFAGDGKDAPFVIFEVSTQSNIAGPYATRKQAETFLELVRLGQAVFLDKEALINEAPLTEAGCAAYPLAMMVINQAKENKLQVEVDAIRDAVEQAAKFSGAPGSETIFALASQLVEKMAKEQGILADTPTVRTEDDEEEGQPVDWVNFSENNWDAIDFVKINGNLHQVSYVDADHLENQTWFPEIPAFKYLVDHGQVVHFASGRLVGAVLLDEQTARLKDGTLISFFQNVDASPYKSAELLPLKFKVSARYNYAVDVIAVEDESDPGLRLGEAKVKAVSKEHAENLALDLLWDHRLDVTCHPRVISRRV